MKYALPTLAAFALFVFSPQAEAEYLGSSVCHESTICGSEFQIKIVAKQRAQLQLNCDPTVGTNCNAVQGRLYTYHITVKSAGWTPRNGVTWHFEWKAKAQTVPTNPTHFIIWSNESLTYIGSDHQQCGLPY